MLDPITNECRIYETRPDVCRLTHPAARRASEYIAGHPIPEAEFYPLTVNACVALQQEAGLGPEWAPVLESP